MPSKTQRPKGWRQVRLEEVAHIRGNRAMSEDDGLTPYIALEHIVAGGRLGGYGKSTDSVSTKTNFQEGDTLYGKLRPNLRKVIRAEFDGVCSTEILAIFAEGKWDGRYLNHLIRSDLLHGHAMQGITGTKMPRTSWSHLKTFEFLSPPLPEQRAIAAVLDSIDDSIELTEAVIAATKQLHDSLLHQLLTSGVPGWHTEWKEAPGIGTIPVDWEVMRLGEVATLQRGIDLPEADRIAGEVVVYGSNGPLGYHDYTPIQGPGVITGRSGSIGIVYYSEESFWPLNTTLYVKDFHGNYERYVYYLLSSLHLERFSASTGVPSLNRNFVHPHMVTVPPFPEQRAIASLLDRVDVTITEARKERDCLQLLKESTADVLLTGQVRMART